MKQLNFHIRNQHQRLELYIKDRLMFYHFNNRKTPSMFIHYIHSLSSRSISCPCIKCQVQRASVYLVKSGGTGVVTNDCIGFLWTCWNMSRISGLLEISSLLLHDRSCGTQNTLTNSKRMRTSTSAQFYWIAPRYLMFYFLQERL